MRRFEAKVRRAREFVVPAVFASFGVDATDISGSDWRVALHTNESRRRLWHKKGRDVTYLVGRSCACWAGLCCYSLDPVSLLQAPAKTPVCADVSWLV